MAKVKRISFNRRCKLNQNLWYFRKPLRGTRRLLLRTCWPGRILLFNADGGGKSLCYQLPSILMEGTAIVISPLIALMKNQVDAMRNFSEEDGVAHFINSSLNKSAIDQVKSDILSGRTKLLYVAPESLTKKRTWIFCVR